MENVFSPQISAFQKIYDSHVLIRLIEEWRQYLDKNFVIGAFLTDLSKAFDCIPHNLLIDKKNVILYLFVSHKPKSISSYKWRIKWFSNDNFWCPSRSASTKTVGELKNTLQSESEVITNWFKNNKFQAIILD